MSLRSRSGESRPFNLRATHIMTAVVTSALLLTGGVVLAEDHEGHDDNGGPGPHPALYSPTCPPNIHGDVSAAIGDRPALLRHLDQGDIDSGRAGFYDILAQGLAVFNAEWTTLDGAGRPLTGGSGQALAFRSKYQFRRTTGAGPDGNSCFGCHSSPRGGGGGSRSTNLFLGFSVADQAIDANGLPTQNALSIDFSHCNERNPPNLFGDGPLEVASREMSFALQAIRSAALAQAAASGQPVTMNLVAKGVSFGKITATPDGHIDPSQIEGCDWDLIIKPFGWKGGLNIRSFEVGGMNLHFGMQPREKFGRGTDPDGDGVTDELFCGDMTAEEVWTAALSPPGQVITGTRAQQSAIIRGKQIFDSSLCAVCHIPKMYLDNPVFTAPGPFNAKAALFSVGVESPEGQVTNTFSTSRPFSFDLTRDGPRPRIDRTPDGRGVIEAYTDLKRHIISEADSGGVEFSRFNNEILPGGTLAGQDAATSFTVTPTPLPAPYFITAKLWGVGNTGPYGHRGDITTITENINFHGGEARASRDAFFAMSKDDQNAVVAFLRSLQIVPDGGPRIVRDNNGGDDH